MPYRFISFILEGMTQKFFSVWLRVSYIGKIIFIWKYHVYTNRLPLKATKVQKLGTRYELSYSVIWQDLKWVNKQF